MPKIPYFPFFPDDWLSSSRIDLLTADQERGFLRLLCRSWGLPGCALPVDENHLLKWSLMPDANALRTVMRLFFDRTDMGWRNPKLYSLWLKAQEKHFKASQSAKCRHNKGKQPCERIADAERMNMPSQCVGNANQNHNQNHKESKETPPQKPAVTPPAKKKKPKDDYVFEGIPEWIDEQCWNEYIAMRDRIRAPLTEWAKHLTVLDLDALRKTGQDPNKVLNQSSQKSWRGVFAVKEEVGHEKSRGPQTFTKQREREQLEQIERLTGIGRADRQNNCEVAGDHGAPTDESGRAVLEGEFSEISAVET